MSSAAHGQSALCFLVRSKDCGCSVASSWLHMCLTCFTFFGTCINDLEAVQTGSNTMMTASARLCTFAGAMFGAIAAYVTAPFIVESLGWPAVFTVYGMVGFVWVVLWSVLVSEGPLHSHMTLSQAAEPHEAPLSIPYKAFATCLPLWAIIIVETSHGGSQVSPTGILSVCQTNQTVMLDFGSCLYPDTAAVSLRVPI